MAPHETLIRSLPSTEARLGCAPLSSSMARPTFLGNIRRIHRFSSCTLAALR